jgi:glycolate oxidase FAD binding subunit
VSIERELASIVGSDYLRERAVELAHNAIDEVVPEYIVEPANEEEVLALVRLANERKLTIYPAGGHTAQGMGRVPPRVDIVLKLGRLTAIDHYDPGDLTMGVSAGACVQSVRAAVSAHRQMLPLEVADAAHSTIGGALARAAHGPLRHAYGGPREFCIGLRFVTGDGRLAKSGGRVVKNVAGYDLMKLLIGSYGTLAIITAANFRLYPAPRQTRTFVADFTSAGEAIAFRDGVMKSALSAMCLEMASPLAQEFLASHSDRQTWRVMVRAGGSDAVLARYARELGDSVTHVFEGAAEESYWTSVVELSSHVHRVHQNAMTVAITAAPTELGPALDVAERAAEDNNLLLAVGGRCAAAAMQLAFIPMPQGAPVITQYVKCVSMIREKLAPDAACIVSRCPTQVKQHLDVWGKSQSDPDVMKSIKHALDAHDVLNRGRFLL